MKDVTLKEFEYRDCPFADGWQAFCRGYCDGCYFPIFVMSKEIELKEKKEN